MKMFACEGREGGKKGVEKVGSSIGVSLEQVDWDGGVEGEGEVGGLISTPRLPLFHPTWKRRVQKTDKGKKGRRWVRRPLHNHLELPWAVLHEILFIIILTGAECRQIRHSLFDKVSRMSHRDISISFFHLSLTLSLSCERVDYSKTFVDGHRHQKYPQLHNHLQPLDWSISTLLGWHCLFTSPVVTDHERERERERERRRERERNLCLSSSVTPDCRQTERPELAQA